MDNEKMKTLKPLQPLKYCKLSGKICYDKKGAQTASNSRYHRDHVKLRIYQCEGTHWHLTSQL